MTGPGDVCPVVGGVGGVVGGAGGGGLPPFVPPPPECPPVRCSGPFVCRYVIEMSLDQGADGISARTRKLTVWRGRRRGLNVTPRTTRYATSRLTATATTYRAAPGTRVQRSLPLRTVSTVRVPADLAGCATCAGRDDAVATPTPKNAIVTSSHSPTAYRAGNENERVSDCSRTRAVRPAFVCFITVTGRRSLCRRDPRHGDGANSMRPYV